ncbi:MAG TPA: HlyD family efflux transporter periplasmic adaptor subunit [Acidobacteriota bacterium]|nr:HlyD family efflux transporter periplasmic adaptor subunit [Acidobacteriota bacterium]
MEKRQYSGSKPLVTSLVRIALLVAALWCLQPASAQNPGLTGAKTSTPIPETNAGPASSKPEEYKVTAGEIVKEIILSGELKAERSIEINSPNIRSSFLNTVSMMAQEGSLVRKGERIIEFDDSSLMSNKSEAERTLDEAKLNILKKKADLEAQRCDLLSSVAQAEGQLKQDELYGKLGKDLLSGNDYQKYQLNVTKSKLALQKAKEELDNFEKSYDSQIALVEIKKSQAEIDLKKIESDMALLKIDAPQDGIIIYGDNWTSNRKIQPGDSLPQGMEVASLPDLTSMLVIGYVYDTEYSSLKPDMRCTVTFDALPGYRVGGRVASLTSVASRKNFATTKKVFQATIQLEKVDASLLKPGMTAHVRIPMVIAKDTPAIPREFLGTDLQGRYFVLKKGADSKPITQIVSIGVVGDRFIQAVSGVSIGDPLLPVQRLAEVTK